MAGAVVSFLHILRLTGAVDLVILPTTGSPWRRLVAGSLFEIEDIEVALPILMGEAARKVVPKSSDFVETIERHY